MRCDAIGCGCDSARRQKLELARRSPGQNLVGIHQNGHIPIPHGQRWSREYDSVGLLGNSAVEATHRHDSPPLSVRSVFVSSQYDDGAATTTILGGMYFTPPPSCLAVKAQSDLPSSLPPIEKQELFPEHPTTLPILISLFLIVFRVLIPQLSPRYAWSVLLTWSAAPNPTNFTSTSPSHLNLPSRASVLISPGISYYSCRRVDAHFSLSIRSPVTRFRRVVHSRSSLISTLPSGLGLVSHTSFCSTPP